MSAFNNNFGDYMKSKVQRLKLQDNQRLLTETDGTLSNIFNGVSIYVNGFTMPSSWELRDLVIAHGGEYEQYYCRSKVTHIIANSLPSSKQELFQNCKVVKPEWIVQSISAKALLPWSHFNALRSVPGQLFLPKPKSLNLDTKTALPIGNPLSSRNGPLMIPVTSLIDNNTSSNVDDKKLIDLSLIPNVSASALDEPSDNDSDSPSHMDLKQKRKELDLKDPWIAQNIATAPGFVKRYFSKSRLHHISTWRTALKKLVGNKGEYPVNVRELERDPFSRVIMHVDMDCFFAQIAVLKDPTLKKDDPVAVAHDSNGRDSRSNSNAEIASCNYAARKHGIRNGMWLKQARSLCPNLKVAPFLFDEYDKASRAMYGVLSEYADYIQACSVDEAFIDVTTRMQGVSDMDESSKRTALAEKIKADVFSASQCVASIGIAHNIFLARLATRRAKPDGVFYLHPNLVPEFLASENVRNFPGVGWQTARVLNEELNVQNGADLLGHSLSKLQGVFGPKTGKTLYDMARGSDMRPLANLPRSTVSVEINWGIRFDTRQQVDKFWDDLAAEASERLVSEGMVASALTVRMKMRQKGHGEAAKFLGCGICDQYSKLISLPIPTNNPRIFAKHAVECHNLWKIPVSEIRGMGFSLTKLQEKTNSGHELTLKQLFSKSKHIDSVSESADNSCSEHQIQRKLNRESNESIGANVTHGSRQAACKSDLVHSMHVDKTGISSVCAIDAQTTALESDSKFYNIFSPHKSSVKRAIAKRDSPTSSSLVRIGNSPSLQLNRFKIQTTPATRNKNARKFSDIFAPSPSHRLEKRAKRLLARDDDDSCSEPADLMDFINGGDCLVQEQPLITQNDYVPRLSQIDSQVLESLPKSIQTEITKQATVEHRRRLLNEKVPQKFASSKYEAVEKNPVPQIKDTSNQTVDETGAQRREPSDIRYMGYLATTDNLKIKALLVEWIEQCWGGFLENPSTWSVNKADWRSLEEFLICMVTVLHDYRHSKEYVDHLNYLLAHVGRSKPALATTWSEKWKAILQALLDTLKQQSLKLLHYV